MSVRRRTQAQHDHSLMSCCWFPSAVQSAGSVIGYFQLLLNLVECIRQKSDEQGSVSNTHPRTVLYHMMMVITTTLMVMMIMMMMTTTMMMMMVVMTLTNDDYDDGGDGDGDGDDGGGGGDDAD